MFEHILTKDSVSFKDLEEIAYKIACEFANEILRNMLEEYDKEIMNTRDTKEYRNKGKETTTVKARTGLVEYTRRMKKRRMSWSKKGSENIAKVITMNASESCRNLLEHLQVQLLPESFAEYAEKYIKEIEKNIKEMKKQKVRTKEIYTFKQSSIEGYPQLKKILEFKPISELIYR